jgi:hypothetical protein
MKRISLIAAFVTAAFVSCGPKYTEPTSEPGLALAYSMSFIRNVVENSGENENLVISPYSAGVP